MSNNDKIKLLEQIYKSPTTGFQSAQKLYQKAKENDKSITMKNVKEYLSTQSTAQITQPVNRPKEFDSIRSPSVRNNYQADICYLPNSKSNSQFKYILTFIDVYSRYVFLKPLKSKTGPVVFEAFQQLMKQYGNPKNLNVDLGSEFIYKPFVKYCQDHEIQIWYSDPEQSNKNAIIERWHRTLRNLILQYTTEVGANYISVLPDLIQNYNTTIHSTIRQKPIDVWNHHAKNHQTYHRVLHKFHAGDKVRHIVKKKTFDKKSSTTNYTKKVYQITRIEGNSYFLDSLTKPFREHELVIAVGNDVTSNYDIENENHQRDSLIERRWNRELG